MIKLWYSTTRKGDWFQTFTGKQFYPLDPKVEDINIEDIAHALSLLCRFGGHCKTFYSVAQHSIIGAEYFLNNSHSSMKYKLAYQFLMHDATEAYLCDLPRPIKRHSRLGDFYLKAENTVSKAISEKFRLPLGFSSFDYIKEIDNRMLVTEKRDLLLNLPNSIKWCEDKYIPFEENIIPQAPEEVEGRFLDLYEQTKC